MMRVGLVQLNSRISATENLGVVREFVAQAHRAGAHYVLTPEVSNMVIDDKPKLQALVKPEAEDISVQGYLALALEFGLWLQAGSFALQAEGGRIVNRSLLFGPDGKIHARYDKIHLFDVDLPSGERIRESDNFQAGTQAVVASLPKGRIGFSICYDVRFPELYQQLARAGAQILVVPAAFTVPTGQAHWHILLRARAIETGSFVLAAAQAGLHESGRRTYGHSMIISPWGEILAEADGTTPQVLIADLDLAQVARDRQRIPALANARPFTLHTPPEPLHTEPNPS